MDFIQVKGNTWCLMAAELIPVYRIDRRRCILLDSGLDWERTGLQEVFEREGLLPVGAIGSHTHVDHVGNFVWLRETYGTRLCLSFGEAAVASAPAMFKMVYNEMSLDTLMGYAGNMIFSTDQVLGPEDGVVEFMGVPFRIHHTPGHSADHICIGTPDGVCYMGDLLMSRGVLEQAKVPYYHVLAQARASMEKMRAAEDYCTYIIAHRGIVTDLSSEVDANLSRLDWISNHFLELLYDPITWDELVTEVRERNHLYTGDQRKFVLYELSERSFLDELIDNGKVTVRVERGQRWFQRRDAAGG